jgi:hypothetical protein
MTPLPVNPTVVVLIDEDNNVVKVASNIAPLPELTVRVLTSPQAFEDEAAGKPFNQVVYQNHLN